MRVQFSNELNEPRKVLAGHVLAAELLHELGPEKGVEKLVLWAAIPFVIVHRRSVGGATALQGQGMPWGDGGRSGGGSLHKGSDRGKGGEEKKEGNGEEEGRSHACCVSKGWGG